MFFLCNYNSVPAFQAELRSVIGLSLGFVAFHSSPEGKQKAANNINMLLLSFSLSCKYNRIQT